MKRPNWFPKAGLLRAALLLSVAALALAHPMGNFSVSHYTRIEFSDEGAEATYVLDLAEIPTFELLRDWKLDAKSAPAALQAKAAEQAQEWMKGLDFQVRGEPVTAKLVNTSIVVSDGAGGLAVARITSTLRLEGLRLTAGRGDLTFEDLNFPERAGWKEIVIRAGSRAEILSASQGDTDRSKGLTVYPPDPTVAPPQDVRAAVTWRVVPPSQTTPSLPTAPVQTTQKTAPKIVPIEQPKPLIAVQATPPPSSTPGAPQAPGTVVKGDFLSRMLGNKDIGLGVMLIGIALAFGLGAIHAFSPGHGKTIVAAYLVGSRGTAKHAAFLGAMVTFTHTISVFLLGLGTLLLSRYVVPEKIIPVLGAISGLSIVVIGGSLFYKRFRLLRASQAGHHDDRQHHDHPEHDHSHDHSHEHDHGHDHAHEASHEHVHARVRSGNEHAHAAHVQEPHTHEAHVHGAHPHDHSHGHTHATAAVHDHGHSHDLAGATHTHGEHTHDGHTHDAHRHSHDHAHVHGHDHSHDHDHSPGHDHGHGHHHGPGGHSHVPEGDITLGSLIALGASGGLVPCPSALVLLLSSIALGHVGLGLILLVSFSLGLAVVLMGIGILVLFAKHLLPDPVQTSRHPLFRLVPVLSALVIICLGLLMTGVSLGWVQPGRFIG